MDSVSNFRSVSFPEPLPLQRDLALAYTAIESRFSTPPHILEPAYDAFIQEFLREISIYIEGDHQYSPQEQADLYLFVDQLIQNHIAKYQETLDPLVYTSIKKISSNSFPANPLLSQTQKTNGDEHLELEISQKSLLDEVASAIKLLDKNHDYLMIRRKTVLFKLSKILIPLILKKVKLCEVVTLLEQLHAHDTCIFQFLVNFRNVLKEEEENGPALEFLRNHLEKGTQKKKFDRLLLWILERTIWWKSDKIQALKEAKKLSSSLDLEWRGDYRWTLFKTAFLSGSSSSDTWNALLVLLLSDQTPSLYLLFLQELLQLFVAFPHRFTSSKDLTMPIKKQMPYLIRYDLHKSICKIIENFKEPTMAACGFLGKTLTSCNISGPQANQALTTLVRRLIEAAHRETNSLPHKDVLKSLLSYFIKRVDMPYQPPLTLFQNMEEDAIRRHGIEVLIELFCEALKNVSDNIELEATLNNFFKACSGESVRLFIEKLFVPAQTHLRRPLLSKYFRQKLEEWIQKDEEWELLEKCLGNFRRRVIKEIGDRKWRRLQAWVIKRSCDRGMLRDREIEKLIRITRLQLTQEEETGSTPQVEPKVLFLLQEVKNRNMKKFIVQTLHPADLAGVVSLNILPFKAVWYYLNQIQAVKRRRYCLDLVTTEKAKLDRKEEESIDLKTEEFVRLLKEDALQITIEAELLSLQAMEDEIRKEAALAELARQEKKA